jgi:hypothetical protein
MTLVEEILSALRSPRVQELPLLDPKVGRVLQQSLQRALGGQVEDLSDYLRAPAYRFDRAIVNEGERWRVVLRVRISGLGPWVTYTFVQGYGDDHWWSGPFRASRAGFSPAEAELRERLLAWFAEQGLTLLDLQTQAVIVPDDIPLPRVRESQLTLFQALFRP